MAKKDTVLVIGGCGGLGSFIVKQLLDLKYPTIAFDITTAKNLHEGATYIQGDLASQDQMQRVLKDSGATVLINTASLTWLQSPSRENINNVNVTGNANLLSCAQSAGVKVFIYTSSSSIVHDNYTDLINATEDLPLVFEPEQKEFYSHTKALAEQAVIAANVPGKFHTASIRAATMIGENDSFTVDNLINNARAGRLRFQAGEGENLFDFTYTGNTAEAHVLAVEKLLAECEDPESAKGPKKVNGEAFFITNDDPWPFWKIPRALGAAAGYPTKEEDVWKIPTGAYFAMAGAMEWGTWAGTLGKKKSIVERKHVRYMTMTRTFDISKAKERLGYKPRVGMEEAVERAVKDWKAKHEGKGKV